MVIRMAPWTLAVALTLLTVAPVGGEDVTPLPSRLRRLRHSLNSPSSHCTSQGLESGSEPLPPSRLQHLHEW